MWHNNFRLQYLVDSMPQSFGSDTKTSNSVQFWSNQEMYERSVCWYHSRQCRQEECDCWRSLQINAFDGISIAAGMLWSFAKTISDRWQRFSHCYWCSHVSHRIWRCMFHDLLWCCTSATCKSTAIPPNWWLIRQGKARKFHQMKLNIEGRGKETKWGQSFFVNEVQTHRINHPKSCTCHVGIWCMWDLWNELSMWLNRQNLCYCHWNEMARSKIEIPSQWNQNTLIAKNSPRSGSVQFVLWIASGENRLHFITLKTTVDSRCQEIRNEIKI